MEKKVGAIVVSYHPDMEVMDALLLSLLDQVDLLILADNGGGQGFLSGNEQARSAIRYVDMQGNKGLGAALNAGFTLADQAGVEYVATFDQDSHASSDLIQRLHQAMTQVLARDSACVAVSPCFFDRRGSEKINFPFYREQGGKIKAVYESEQQGSSQIRVDTLITSGMFVSVSAWCSGLKYNEGMFVDYTDTEWCFRATSQGRSLYGCSDIEMGHALSDAPPVKVLGLSFFRYSPVRRYFYFRNTVAVVLMPHTPKAWRRRLAMGLMLRFFVNLYVDKRTFASLKMMLKGTVHGFIGKLGGAQ